MMVKSTGMKRKSSGIKVNNGCQKTITSMFANINSQSISDTESDVEIVESSESKRVCLLNNESTAVNDGQELCEIVAKPAKTLRNKRCEFCSQWLDDVSMYEGDPPGSEEEVVCLTNPSLQLYNSEDKCTNGYWDDRPQYKITDFSVYCPVGHVCAFDSGLIERNADLHFSGYVKPLDCEDASKDGGFACARLGPIDEWYIAGFDGGEKVVIALTTAFADYILMEAKDEYKHLMSAITQKVYLAKLIIELLSSTSEPDDLTYEDILSHMANSSAPAGCAFSEEQLLRHAQFIVDQIQSYEEDGAPLGYLFWPCMRSLIELGGVLLPHDKQKAAASSNRSQSRSRVKLGRNKPANSSVQQSKATVTDLVRSVFDSMFNEQLDEKIDKNQSVTNRMKDLNVDEEGSGSDNENNNNKVLSPSRHVHKFGRQANSTVKVCGEPYLKEGSRHYYRKVLLNGCRIEEGDCVRVQSIEPTIPFYIARVVQMWRSGDKGPCVMHATFFYRGRDTILGDIAGERELFMVDECETCEMTSCLEKVDVNLTTSSSSLSVEKSASDNRYFCYKSYDHEHGRFIDFKDNEQDFYRSKNNSESKPLSCPVCCRQKQRDADNRPSVEDLINTTENGCDYFATLLLRGRRYAINSSMMLAPGTLKRKFSPAPARTGDETGESKSYDEVLYPEKYRKSGGTGYIKGSNDNIVPPYDLAKVKSIFRRSGGGPIKVVLSPVYRCSEILCSQVDLGLVFLSEEEVTVEVNDKVIDKCWIIHSDNLDSYLNTDEYFITGHDRFHYNEYYSHSVGTTFPITHDYRCPDAKEFHQWFTARHKWIGKSQDSDSPGLATLDVFAGCGGLSEGLHQAGVAHTKWAVESNTSAADAFQVNHPACTVLTDCCNTLLKLAMQGKKTNCRGQSIPQPGEVELLCGGPPCQGFSGMNRFNYREYSKFKNSLVATFLSYCDFYRPKYFLMENVRNFVSYKKGMVLRLTLRCLLAMGYQVSFGILQAATYGVPQTRRRCIVLAAAPGCPLPNFPSPQFTFTPKGLHLSVQLDEHRFEAPFSPQRFTSAPYPQITVGDAMGDLPAIVNGANKVGIEYRANIEELTHFQRISRKTQFGFEREILRDHICKEMSPLVVARFERIPLEPGSDWRDLPNVSVRLHDGTVTKLLRYTHYLRTAGQNPAKDHLKGVCSCAEGKGIKCEPSCRQFDTLIPWCLPHTGDRHNHWAGLYGRLSWDGHFSTTITNPEPMGKQGRVLHPTQHRVVSVRECARSQGFPDHYCFSGNIMDKHRQVGNAVPPPLARAIGIELLNSLLSAEFETAVN